MLLNELEHLEEQIRTLNKEIAALSRTDHYRERCQRLCSQLSGVGPLTAMTFLVELFRPEEFPNAESLASHMWAMTVKEQDYNYRWAA